MTIPAGQRTAELLLPVVNDGMPEMDETVVITLHDPMNAELGSPSVFTYTIRDNEQPRVQFSSSVSSGLESTTLVTLPVTLSNAVSYNVKVKYRVTGGSASPGGVDFTLPDGELTIPAGMTTVNLSFTVNNDVLNESDETIVVMLLDPTDASLGSFPVHVYSITDNE